jgi:hypothetical protein
VLSSLPLTFLESPRANGVAVLVSDFAFIVSEPRRAAQLRKRAPDIRERAIRAGGARGCGAGAASCRHAGDVSGRGRLVYWRQAKRAEGAKEGAT